MLSVGWGRSRRGAGAQPSYRVRYIESGRLAALAYEGPILVQTLRLTLTMRGGLSASRRQARPSPARAASDSSPEPEPGRLKPLGPVELRKLRMVVLYGRREVGKSFLMRRFLRPTHYFFVLRSRDVIYVRGDSREALSYGEFAKLALELVRHEEYFVAVDEFQRLSGEFLDLLHSAASEIRARVFLVGSSLRFVERVLREHSPLLGLFQVYRLDLVRCRDAYAYFHGALRGRELAKTLAFLRDPWLLAFYADNVDDAIVYSLRNVPGLVGEVFAEEYRRITETYERVLRAMAMGNYLLRSIASYTGRPLNEVKPYLRNLMDMGLVKRVKVFGKRKWLYKIRSPIMDLFYYLDTRYGISEIEAGRETLKREIDRRLPLYFEDYVREALAEKHGGQEEVSLSPQIDGIITVAGRPVACVEVKLGRADRRDEEAFLRKTAGLRCTKLLVTPESLHVVMGSE